VNQDTTHNSSGQTNEAVVEQSFCQQLPEQWKFPIVLSSPHSGRHIPETMLASSRLSLAQLRGSEDSYLEELLADAPSLGVPLQHGLYSRAYIDLNREPYELDQRMFSDRLPSHANITSPRVLSGLGTIPRVAADGCEIYHSKLQFAEALHRITHVYLPYHRALSTLLDAAHAKLGFALLLDCHSMPHSAVANQLPRSSKVDIVIGDRFGSTAETELIEMLDWCFVQAGFVVRRNRPYAGGFITETHGNPRSNRHAIQIEINRSLYMNELTLQKHEGFVNLRRALAEILASYCTLIADRGTFSEKLLAAE
jgi:N-formylglutamate amidohydrolase